MASRPFAKLNKSHPTPLYQQIKQLLEQQIAEGALAAGDQLPSEKELQESFGVSRITVRQALQELVSEGKIKRVPGKGSFVLHTKAEPLSALTSFSENMRALGLTPGHKTERIALCEPPAHVRTALQLDEEAEALYLHRILLANDAPIAIQHAYFSSAIYHRRPDLLSKEQLDNNSLYRLLEQEFQLDLWRAREYVDPAVATEVEAEQLGVQPGDLLLIVVRITYGRDERPIEHVSLIFRADRYRYHVELFRP